MSTRGELLWNAAILNDTASLLEHLERTTAEDLKFERNGITALGLAALMGHTDVTTLLINAFLADVNHQDSKDGQTALMRASDQGHFVIVQGLVKANASLNLKDNNGFTAADFAKTEEIRELVSSKARKIWFAVFLEDKVSLMEHLKGATEEDFMFVRTSFTALGVAAQKGHTEIVTLLLQTGANPDYQKNEMGLTALILASIEGHSDVVRALIEAKADINIQDKVGWTALMKASVEGHTATVHLLIEAGVNINLQDKHGMTALMWASIKVNSAIILALIGAKADLHLKDKENGDTALILASAAGHSAIVQALVDANADPNQQNKHGKTALTRASTAEIRNVLTAYVDNYVPPPPPVINTLTLTPPTKAQPAPVPPISAAPVKPAKSAKPVTPRPESGDIKLVDGRSALSSAELKADGVSLVEYQRSVQQLLQSSAHLQQVMSRVAAHDRALRVLVSKEKECPSLFWFYPKKPELRSWLSNPAKCLFQDTLMMVVVCPVTLCVVPCGPDGVGWEVTMPKKWVKKWGPAILFSIYVLQAAVVTGRVVGIPLPPLPNIGNLKKALGLNGMLGDGFSKGVNEANMSDCLSAFADTTKATLDLNPELQALCAGLKLPTTADAGQELPANLPMHVVDEAYKSIHTFLTMGESEKLGKLEDQLRGRMERVMAPDGDIEWVSVEGRDAWLQKHATLVSDAPPSLQPMLSTSVKYKSNTWLSIRMQSRGLTDTAVLVKLDQVLVSSGGEGFTLESELAALPPEQFHQPYLESLGISAKGTQMKLIALHRELHAQYTAASNPPSPPTSTNSVGNSVSFTAEEKARLLSLTKELNKRRGGGGGGLVLHQEVCDLTNPFTGRPYTMNELAAEIHRLQVQDARRSSEIADIAAATKEGLEQTHISVTSAASPTAPTDASVADGSKIKKPRKGLFGFLMGKK